MAFTRMTAAEAASLIKNGDNIGLSGFTPAGTPKAVTAEIAKIAHEEHEEPIFQTQISTNPNRRIAQTQTQTQIDDGTPIALTGVSKDTLTEVTIGDVLTVGTHSVKVKFNGNDTYASSEVEKQLTVI